MKSLNPYLILNGRCREALAFYQSCLGGTVETLMTYAEAKLETPPGFGDYVLHSAFRSEGVHFMASDGRCGEPSALGENVQLSLDFGDPAEQARVFDALAQDGTVSMPLQDTFWDARFGMLTDRFGIHWMLNCRKG